MCLVWNISNKKLWVEIEKTNCISRSQKLFEDKFNSGKFIKSLIIINSKHKQYIDAIKHTKFNLINYYKGREILLHFAVM